MRQVDKPVTVPGELGPPVQKPAEPKEEPNPWRVLTDQPGYFRNVVTGAIKRGT